MRITEQTPQGDLPEGVDGALAWIHDAGNPYFDWLFGDPRTARGVLARWLRRPDSEVAAARVRLVERDGGPVGGYIALTAEELRAARRADAMALLAEVPSGQRRGQLAKLRGAEGLFTEPADDEFYLSKMGVRSEARGKGHGRAVLEAFVAEAAARGFERLRLDVSADNGVAIGLYRSAGFVPVEAGQRSRAGLTYLPMTRTTCV